MGSHEHDLVTSRAPWELGFEVVDRFPFSHDRLPRHLVALRQPRRFDVLGRALECRWTPELALTDLPGEHTYVLRQTVAECHLIGT
jgi:hypothetical protein